MKKKKISFSLFILLPLTILFFTACETVSSPPINSEVKMITSPRVLPDDLSSINILFTKNENDETYVNITNVGMDYKIVHNTIKEANHIQLAPSGNNILYSSGEDEKGEYKTALYSHNLDTSKENRIIISPQRSSWISYRTPNFFPNEEQIIFQETNYEDNISSLIILDPKSGSLNRIFSDNNINLWPIVSPDGKSILVICGGMDINSREPGFQICRINLRTGSKKLITFDGDMHDTYFFTPDNQRVVYSEWETGGLFKIIEKPYHKIFSVDVEGENRKYLLDFEGVIKAISPDGQDIILEGRPNEDYPYSIYIVGIDGSNLRHLTYFDEFLADWYPEEEE